jgi:hypothetical protein
MRRLRSEVKVGDKVAAEGTLPPFRSRRILRTPHNTPLFTMAAATQPPLDSMAALKAQIDAAARDYIVEPRTGKKVERDESTKRRSQWVGRAYFFSHTHAPCLSLHFQNTARSPV